MRRLLFGCPVLAALSLLLPAPPGADAWAWLVWGREIVHLELDTTGGPSWKPLGALGAAPLTVFGDAAPGLWLLAVRTAGLLALVLAGRLAWRLAREAGAGARLAGAGGAAAGLALAPAWADSMAQGYSEPLVAAALLGAADRELAGRRSPAILLAWVVGLARPEGWPFLALYGIWVWRCEPARRALLAGLALSLPVLWFVPDWIGAGDPFFGGRRARSGGTVGLDFGTLADAAGRGVAATPAPLLALAGLAIAAAAARRRRAPVVLGALAAAWLVLIVAMTAIGYLGIARFFIPSAALLCAVGGAGLAELAAMAPRPRTALAVALLALSIPSAVARFRDVGRQLDGLARVDELQRGVGTAVGRAGGRDAVLARGAVVTTASGTDRPLAWELRAPLGSVRLRGGGPGRARAVVFGPRSRRRPAGRVLARTRAWWVVATRPG